MGSSSTVVLRDQRLRHLTYLSIHLIAFAVVIYQSNRSFNIHPRGNPPGIWTFEDWPIQIPSPRGKKAVQMPHLLLLKYLSSKTNFVFNQTLFTLFRERCAMMTPLDFFWRPFRESYSLKKGKFYLVHPSNLVKIERNHRSITPEQEINPVQIPHLPKATFKFPPSRAQCTVSNWSAHKPSLHYKPTA